MPEVIWSGSTVTVYFRLWDGEDPNQPPITDPAEVTVIVRGPGDYLRTFTLTGGTVTPVPGANGVPGSEGEFRVRFDTAGEGRYVADCTALTQTGYTAKGVAVLQTRAVPTA